MIRRSDDLLKYDCETNDGKEAVRSIRSEVEGEKMAASIIFWDLGITDSITDNHRTYQGNVTITVPRAKSPWGRAGRSQLADCAHKLNEHRDKNVTFLAHENGGDVYLNHLMGELNYMGRS